MPLDWVEAERKHARPLKRFVCTDPATSKWDRVRRQHLHERPWELRVQSDIRTQLRPPRQAPEYMYLGLRGGEICAVIAFFVNKEEDRVFILVVARSVDGARNGLGQEAMEKLLELTAEKAPGLKLVTRIHHKNRPSQKLFSSNGFARTTETEGYELWERIDEPKKSDLALASED